ncbi:major facilitator family transporter [Legionella geestiana]|uniref:Major facilitator family transporter n=1 Tax=Legionella geestiana TaxID=45065 RepID=A0A0W0U965_9GAMM|nr:MFS transporter [Legionella geestiana]KTD04520.1 major facilitator family transporter [Legionella geestiana]QBS12289.1 MFS transporter [Legionella geestiana]STX52976.1 major facilitator family transporter [Legionella geestiana]
MKKTQRIIGALVGNLMQFYDFTIYAFLTEKISKNFFPAISTPMVYLSAICVFATGYLTRPIGALLFGHIGDKYGRSKALSYTIVLSTAATFLIGILPTFNMIGYFSTVFLILLRLLQGLAVSGEEGGAVVLLFEHNRFKNTGLIGSLVLSSVLLGVVLGSLICFFSSNIHANIGVNAWAWRLPFLFSLPLGIMAIRLRYSVNDFDAFSHAKKNMILHRTPTKILIQNYFPEILSGISIASLYSITTSTVIVNIPYVLGQIGLQKNSVFFIITLTLSLITIISPIIGEFLDRFCKNTPKIDFIFLSSIAAPPIAFYLLSTGMIAQIIIALILLAIIISLISSTVFDLIVSTFPYGVRYSGVSLSFNISITIFSSTTPIMLTLLENKQTNLALCGAYLSLIAAVMLLLYKLSQRYTNQLEVAYEKL